MKKHVRMLSLAMALVMTLSVASTAAVAADAEEDVLTAQEDVVRMKKVRVSYYSGFGFWNKVGESQMVSVPANAHVLTAEDCAETMPEGYEFVLSTLIMVGFTGNQAVVYVKEAPAVKPEPEQPQVPQVVEPESFTVKFVNDNDEVVSEQVLVAHTESFYTGIEIPEGNWFCNELRLAVYPGAYISGQTLDEDYTWYEKNPTVVFYANNGNEDPEPQAVEPESFTVKFINDNDEVVSEQVLVAHTESFYTGIEIPEGNWFCNELRLAVYPGAYISGQTLDEDYTWYEANPTVVFYAN